MTPELYKSILAMDSYNRGYGASITMEGDSIGEVSIAKTSIDGVIVNLDSAVIRDPITNEPIHQESGFYALAYDYNGQKIISFRGTDSLVSLPFWDGDVGSDIWNGWSVGAGATNTEQAEMAFWFYQAVAGEGADLRTANISLTGHSLGGGLSGANDNRQVMRESA